MICKNFLKDKIHRIILNVHKTVNFLGGSNDLRLRILYKTMKSREENA